MWRVLFRLWAIGAAISIGLLLLISSSDSRPNALSIYLEAALVPAGAVLVLGIALRWAFGGFQRNNWCWPLSISRGPF